MGRPPCCDKVGIKKGPWTPEEDIILVSYIQEHGPGNWRAVPTNTGLLRCSKSCRLRWTNYLRPGIKRGNFTPHEEGMIVHLQALLGNKWAAIASYLPQRTDNDIKNYWNTHLKKKLKKFQAGLEPQSAAAPNSTIATSQFVSKSFNNRSSLHMKISTQSQSCSYASSTENISRLLQGWMRSSPNQHHKELQREKMVKSDLKAEFCETKDEQEGEMMSHEEFDSILSFENLNNPSALDKSTGDSMPQKSSEEAASSGERNKLRCENSCTIDPPFSVLEKWLLDENVGHAEEMMELSPIF